MAIRTLRFGVAALLLGGCTPAPAGPLHVSIAELHETPAALAGRDVVVEGYLFLCWEGGHLSTTRAEGASPNVRHTLRLHPSRDLQDPEQYDGTLGRVRGTVFADEAHGRTWPRIVVEHVQPWGRYRPRHAEPVPPVDVGPDAELRETLRRVRTEVFGGSDT